MPSFDARDLNLNISKEELKPLYELKPMRVLFSLIAEWVVIVGSIVLCVYWFNALSYLLAVIVIGSRMHALAVIMHDVAHFRFFKNRKLSDYITDVLVCWPMMINVDSYRKNHLGHHQHLNTEEDPDWMAKLGRKEFRHPQSKSEFIGRLFLYLIGYQGIMDLRWMIGRVSQNKKSPRQKREILLFYIILFTLFTLLSWWKFYLLFWVVPFFTSFLMFQYIRSFAEHFGELEYTHLLNSTRSVYPSWIESIMVAPYNISYHLEHHLYPGVPYYNLPKLRKLLLKDPSYREKAHYSRGYFSGLLSEL
jgi:fatty acid desaturase